MSFVLASVAGSAAKAMFDKLTEDGVQKAVGRAISMMNDRSSGGDLISYSQPARLEPILLLDQRATYVPFVRDVIHTMSNLFTAYFLQSIALDTTISGVKVLKRLDKFNPDRDLSVATRSMLSTESYKDGLPFPGESIGFEAYGPAFENTGSKEPVDYLDGSNSDNKYSADSRDVTKMVNDITNLAVGKMIEVTISENGQSAKIPVTVRMRVTGMSPQVMTETLSIGGYDGSFKSRWRQWRAGEIRFWADAVFAMDRIEAHKKAAMKDKSGYYAAVHKRDARNGLASVMTGSMSVGTASSIIVMTEQTRKELERNLNRKISDFRTRQDVFQNTYAMLMVVIDPEWETVTVYHRGIEMPTELTAKDITTSAKGNGPDITEILKMFMEGKAPGRL